MINPELILPGGDIERTKIAFQFGADAVYVGLNEYSLRKAEVRFSLDEIKEAISYAHRINKRLFVTFNILAHNKDLSKLKSEMLKVASFKPDAFIIADPGIVSLSQQLAPEIPIHLSTQANTINIEGVKFWQKQGVKRIVLARELSLDEINEIHAAVPSIELEIFVQGAMCVSYSGRCLLSNYMTGREANLGNCSQPCRWDYNMYIEEKMRPGQYYPIYEESDGTFVMSSKDLRLIKYLPEIIDAGVTGLKVEGRNKSEYYLVTTASTYRRALELIKKHNYTLKDKNSLESELEKLNYRGYTTGFLFGKAKTGEISKKRTATKSWDYVGIVCDKNNTILVKNKLKVKDKIEVITPDGVRSDVILDICDEKSKNNKLLEINPGSEDQKAVVTLTRIYPINSILRKKL